MRASEQRRRSVAHSWFTQNGVMVKATCEPSTEEKLVLVALDATEQALEKPVTLTQGKKLDVDWFSEPTVKAVAIGRWDKRI